MTDNIHLINKLIEQELDLNLIYYSEIEWYFLRTEFNKNWKYRTYRIARNLYGYLFIQVANHIGYVILFLLASVFYFFVYKSIFHYEWVSLLQRGKLELSNNIAPIWIENTLGFATISYLIFHLSILRHSKKLVLSDKILTGKRLQINLIKPFGFIDKSESKLESLLISNCLNIIWKQRVEIQNSQSVIFKIIEHRQELEEYIINSVTSNFRERINSNKQLNHFQDRLKVESYKGLSEIFHPDYEISTPMIKELNSMLKNTSGGTFGLAGPRGVGKSTIINILCEKNKDVDGKKVLAIKIPAPVDYIGREFILNLFSVLCQRFLEINNIQYAWSPPEIHKRQNDNITNINLSILFFGLFLISTYYYPNTQFLFSEMELKRSLVLTTGVLLSTISASMLFITHIHKTSEVLSKFSKRALDKFKQIDNDDIVKLSFEIHRWMGQIKFQQSFTSDVTGNIKSPSIGIESGFKNAYTLANQQLSLPEITHGFMSIVKLLSIKYKVIIGIDELDKIESDEKAQRFLNDIKSLFGIENCFFFISISESALSSFEQRGFAFRDTFDSCFDHIIHVNYLDYDLTKSLINRRVIGIPESFLAFAYCMSGGLPRDLIRIARDLCKIQSVRSEDENTISTLCSKIISNDILSKINAITVKTQKIKPNNYTNELFLLIYKLENQLKLGEISNLKRYCEDQFDEFRLFLEDITDGVQSENDTRQNLFSISEELGVYIDYVLTINQYFSNLSNHNIKQRMLSAIELRLFDRLSEAYRYLSICPKVSVSILENINQAPELVNLFSKEK